MTQVAIHQPNFLPWLGFFDKLVRAQAFVFLDDAVLTQTGGSWTNRCRIRVAESPAWLTIPVRDQERGRIPIGRMTLADGPWRRKLIETLRIGYARAPHFRPVFELVAPLIEARAQSLADYNEGAVRALCRAMGISCEHTVRASAFGVTSTATQRLVDLVRAAGGCTYLSGDGAGGYQEPELFAAHGVGLELQAFAHPVYSQRWQPFCPGLSVVDALMNEGFEAVGAWLRRALPRPARIGSGSLG